MKPVAEHEDNFDFRDPSFIRKIEEGAIMELRRFGVAEKFPADPYMAEVHYRANWFGVRSGSQNRVCPCCLERIKERQFDFFQTNMNDSFLSSDIVLLFGFVRMLVYFFFMRLVVTDLFNVYTSYTGNDCIKTAGCIPTLYQRLTVINKMYDETFMFLVDILNFAFLGLSIIYLLSYDRYFYHWYTDMSLQIQTEDDFTLFVSNIPILQDVVNYQINYVKGIEKHFSDIVKEWLLNPVGNQELYQEYAKVAMNHGHNPQNPPRIVAKVNLCWDNYELTKINRQKQDLQEAFEQFQQQHYQPNNTSVLFQRGLNQKHTSFNKDKEDVYYDYDDTMGDMETLNRAQISLCQQFQLNHNFGFVVSKFLGKAFVSFQYQHFKKLVYDRIEQKPFENHKVRGTYASHPRDVYWQNIHVTKKQRLKRMVITFFVCAACLFLAFLVVIGIKYQQRKYLNGQKKLALYKVIGITVIVSIFTLLINWVLRTIIKKLAVYEQHQTKSKEDASIMYKAIISVIFNQILNPIFVNLLLGNKLWSPNGLATQITSLLVISLILQIVRSVFNFKYIWSWIKFKWQYRKAPPILKFQDNYNLQYALLKFYTYEKYAYYLDELYLIAFFAYLVPLGSLIGIILFMVHYLTDKFYLLKKSSFHPNYSYTLPQIAIVLAESSVLFYALGNYMISGIYTGKWMQPINMLGVGIAVIFTILVWVDPLRRLLLREHTMYEKKSYSDCSNASKFFHTYYSLNPASKLASNTRKNKRYIGVDGQPIPAFCFQDVGCLGRFAKGSMIRPR